MSKMPSRSAMPRNVSAVDSGNLAGHLIALAHACRGFAQSPPLAPAWREGITDVLVRWFGYVADAVVATARSTGVPSLSA